MEIDHSYQESKATHSKYSYHLPFIIDRIPKPLEFSETEDPDNEGYYNHISHEKFIIAKNEEKSLEKMGFQINIGLMLFFILVMPIFDYLVLDNRTTYFSFFTFVSFTVGLLFLVLACRRYMRHKKRPDYIYIIFNRIEKTITLPTSDGQKSFKIYFKDLIAKTMNTGKIATQVANKPKLLFFVDTSGKIGKRKKEPFIDMTLLFVHDHAQETWSMYVWYMDKNRPLPPGSTFDAYRDQDFERRKTEGFPPPLYKSVVPTPEENQEQQAEREKHWKDEEYIVDAKEAKFNIWTGFKDIIPPKK